MRRRAVRRHLPNPFFFDLSIGASGFRVYSCENRSFPYFHYRVSSLRLSMDRRIRYRKAFGVSGQPVWHFNPGCPDYPTSEYVECDDAPAVQDLCRKCAAPEERSADSKSANKIRLAFMV